MPNDTSASSRSGRISFAGLLFVACAQSAPSGTEAPGTPSDTDAGRGLRDPEPTPKVQPRQTDSRPENSAPASAFDTDAASPNPTRPDATPSDQRAVATDGTPAIVAARTDAGPPAPPPMGKVPMFIAAGHGGRTITSCDDGKTWIANHQYDNSNADHSATTEKGFAYGNGLFVHLIGWGAPPSVKVSRNGIDWKRFDVPRGGDGGLVFIDKPAPAFVALGGYGGCQTSPDGEKWSRCPAPNFPENLREAGGGGPALAVGGDIPSVFSFDGGKTWKGSGPCKLTDSFGNLGQEGGFAWGKDRFVGVGMNGSFCQTTDLGVTWKTGMLMGAASGKMAFLGDRFVAPNGRDGHVSEDGVTWTKEVWKPAGTVIHAMARSPGGTFVGVDRSGASNKFSRSTDGVNWTPVPGPSGPSLRRMLFGYGDPSAMCPPR